MTFLCGPILCFLSIFGGARGEFIDGKTGFRGTESWWGERGLIGEDNGALLFLPSFLVRLELCCEAVLVCVALVFVCQDLRGGESFMC